MNRNKLLARITRGAMQNVSFRYFVNLAEGFGFSLARVRGSHHVYVHADAKEILTSRMLTGRPSLIR